ncbi:hypothetical protein JYU14_03175 [Simkania negevensis]|uniref:HlyD family efflux transporter periplasmic adaptor subunit n=1 Tax=Simkania negevensis TaxID=83561 RepID=A0ABS3ARS4_9BACT|nr:hypothetical protein [Simkania negevensis]
MNLKGFAGRGVYLLAACVVLLLAIVVIWLLVIFRPEPKKIPVAATAYEVTGALVMRGRHPVQVSLYGTARSARTLHLIAPFSGKIADTAALFPGAYLPAGTTLYQLEREPYDYKIAQIDGNIAQLDLAYQRDGAVAQLLASQLVTTKRQLSLAEQSEEKEEGVYEVQKSLFNRTEKLFEEKIVSESNYLDARLLLDSKNLLYLRALNGVESARNALDQLFSSILNIENAIASYRYQRQLLEKQKEDLVYVREKATIVVDFPVAVSEVSAYVGQEVLAGAPLAVVEAVDEIEVAVTLPDSYFRWLYQGGMLDGEGMCREVDIHLVNSGYQKIFQGGYLKAIGQLIHTPSRSLPFLFARRNIFDEAQRPLESDELKPGMYCKVNVTLAYIDATFVVPRHAVQEHNRIFYVDVEEPDPQDTYPLKTLHNVNPLLETDLGLIVEIPTEKSALLIITHQLPNAHEGMPIRIKVGST